VTDQLRADVSRGSYAAPAREPLGLWVAAGLERIRPPHSKIKVSTWKIY
jgi:hypothetical protein